MTTPLLEATYLLQASAAAIEAIQVPFLLDAYIPSVFSLMYTYLPSLNPHNWQPNQRAERWPSPRPSPLLHNPRPNQDPQPIPEANPTLRARKSIIITILWIWILISNIAGHSRLSMYHRLGERHPLLPVYLVCVPSLFSLLASCLSSIIPNWRALFLVGGREETLQAEV